MNEFGYYPMSWNDNELRGKLRDYRITNGRDPPYIWMDQLIYTMLMNWQEYASHIHPMPTDSIYGIPIKIWNKPYIGFQPYLEITKTWEI